jgi:hypothetical protein
MESPESVSLVAPPTRIMTMISAASVPSQSRKARAWRAGNVVSLLPARAVVEDIEV